MLNTIYNGIKTAYDAVSKGTMDVIKPATQVHNGLTAHLDAHLDKWKKEAELKKKRMNIEFERTLEVRLAESMAKADKFCAATDLEIMELRVHTEATKRQIEATKQLRDLMDQVDASYGESAEKVKEKAMKLMQEMREDKEIIQQAERHAAELGQVDDEVVYVATK